MSTETNTPAPCGKADLLVFIYHACAAARGHTDARNFGWAKDSLANAKLAAEAYAILVEADRTPSAETLEAVSPTEGTGR